MEALALSLVPTTWQFVPEAFDVSDRTCGLVANITGMFAGEICVIFEDR